MMRQDLLKHFLSGAMLTGIALFSTKCLAQQSLSLDAVLQSVDKSYPQIIAARFRIGKAQGDYLTSLGQFDPSLHADLRSQPVGGYINHSMDNEIVIPTLMNGIKFFGGYRIGRGDWPSYYQNFLTNSGGEYRAGLSLPLLRNRQIDGERTEILTQAETIKLHYQDAEATRIQVYHESIRAYWEWVRAGFQLKTLKKLQKLAETRQEAIVKQARAGDMPTLAISENQQIILKRQQLINEAQMRLKQAAVGLSLYYRNHAGKPLLVHIKELPHSLVRKKSDKPEVKTKNTAQIKSHPALKKLSVYTNILQLKKNLAANELLPNLDARTYAFKQFGSGGDSLLLQQALMAGLVFKFPILQREAKGKLISTQSELQSVTTERRFLFEKLKNEFKNLLIAAEIFQKQTQLLLEELRLAQKVERGENKKFYAGDSTLFLVNQREQTTTQVELNLIDTRVNLGISEDLIHYFILKPFCGQSLQQQATTALIVQNKKG